MARMISRLSTCATVMTSPSSRTPRFAVSRLRSRRRRRNGIAAAMKLCQRVKATPTANALRPMCQRVAAGSNCAKPRRSSVVSSRCVVDGASPASRASAVSRTPSACAASASSRDSARSTDWTVPSFSTLAACSTSWKTSTPRWHDRPARRSVRANPAAEMEFSDDHPRRSRRPSGRPRSRRLCRGPPAARPAGHAGCVLVGLRRAAARPRPGKPPPAAGARRDAGQDRRLAGEPAREGLGQRRLAGFPARDRLHRPGRARVQGRDGADRSRDVAGRGPAARGAGDERALRAERRERALGVALRRALRHRRAAGRARGQGL